MSDSLSILGFAGSLRAASLNRALLDACRELRPEEAALDVFDLAPLPLYNEDLDQDGARPESVEQFKAAIDAADAVLVVTPEYNGGMPGVLKNALDWASRPAFRSPLAEKPVGMMGASPGGGGTMRAHEDLRCVLLNTLSAVYPGRGVAIARAGDKFADGRLVDERTRQHVAGYLDGFARWARRLSA